jgi:MFS family permease
LYFAGQTASSIGTFIHMTAMSWLVYRLTHSEFMLGLVGFVGELPGTLVALMAGTLIDRANPHRIVIVTQTLAMLQAFALGILVVSDQINMASILLLAAVLGAVNGFDVPARQVLVAQLVPAADLRNAVALTSLSLDAARLAGAALGGVAVAAWGEGPCFLANAASFAVIVIALLAMRPWPAVGKFGGIAAARSLSDGLKYAFKSPSIRSIIFLVAFVSFAASPFAVLLPVMAGSVLEGGPRTLGLLSASTGVGALAGAFFLGARQEMGGLPRHIAAGAGLFGLGLLCFSLSRSLVLSMASLTLAGFGVMILMASSHAVLLSIAEGDKRGRVMSLFTLSFMGTVPVGSLVAGALASRIGSSLTVGIGASLCMASALAYSYHLSRGPIALEKSP